MASVAEACPFHPMITFVMRRSFTARVMPLEMFMSTRVTGATGTSALAA